MLYTFAAKPNLKTQLHRPWIVWKGDQAEPEARTNLHRIWEQAGSSMCPQPGHKGQSGWLWHQTVFPRLRGWFSQWELWAQVHPPHLSLRSLLQSQGAPSSLVLIITTWMSCFINYPKAAGTPSKWRAIQWKIVPSQQVLSALPGDEPFTEGKLGANVSPEALEEVLWLPAGDNLMCCEALNVTSDITDVDSELWGPVLLPAEQRHCETRTSIHVSLPWLTAARARGIQGFGSRFWPRVKATSFRCAWICISVVFFHSPG